MGYQHFLKSTKKHQKQMFIPTLPFKKQQHTPLKSWEPKKTPHTIPSLPFTPPAQNATFFPSDVLFCFERFQRNRSAFHGLIHNFLYKKKLPLILNLRVKVLDGNKVDHNFTYRGPITPVIQFKEVL